MKKYKYLAAVLGISMVLTMAGCGKKQDSVVEATPTPEATAAPTAVPVTVTPVPTSTPAPKVIGVKTTDAKFVYLTNSLSSDLREIYLMTSGGEDWGKNLIPSESSVKGAEQVQMYYTYTPSTESTDSEDTSEDSTEDTSSTSTELYDMKIVTSDGNTYEIYSIDLGDMEKASLTMDTDSETAYLRYMSLSEKKEKDTRDNSQQTSSSDDESSDDSSYDDSSYDDSGYDDSSDDGSYDDSSDDGSDDGSYDDGNYDDGSYDDGSDDGSYDDSGYIDDSGDDGYDTDWN